MFHAARRWTQRTSVRVDGGKTSFKKKKDRKKPELIQIKCHYGYFIECTNKWLFFFVIIWRSTCTFYPLSVCVASPPLFNYDNPKMAEWITEKVVYNLCKKTDLQCFLVSKQYHKCFKMHKIHIFNLFLIYILLFYHIRAVERAKSSPSASSKPHLARRKKWGEKSEREKKKGGGGGEGGPKEERAREERRCNYQECSLRDQLHFKEARPRVPCSTQPQVPVLWE